MNERIAPDTLEKLLQDLESDSFGARKKAAEQLGLVDTSNQQIVQALTDVECHDPSFIIRDVARQSLRAPVHKEALAQYRPVLQEKIGSDDLAEAGLRSSGVIIATIFGAMVGAIAFFWIGFTIANKSSAEINLLIAGILGAMAGTVVGFVVATSEREWRFMEIFEDWDQSDLGRDAGFGIAITLALIFFVAVAETVWVIVTAIPRVVIAPRQWTSKVRQFIRSKDQ